MANLTLAELVAEIERREQEYLTLDGGTGSDWADRASEMDSLLQFVQERQGR